MDLQSRRQNFAIWGFAMGYFLTYIPYSALTRADAVLCALIAPDAAIAL